MTTQEQRAEWRELADDGGLSEGNEIVLALLADMDALTQERDAAYRAIERMSRKQTEMHDTLQARNAALTAERDALAAAWAQVVAISDEMNPKQGGPFGGDTNIAAYNMSRVRDVVREWKEAQNAVFE